ncbi:restriction endonuclease [Pseudovibrio sp. WM33]|uniref:restriction endonuclease n=1 Tax=Pseudovibrio sp. WM33 TaxID=1735585 RepID=UPI0007B188B1|nr:restriction endonuclease [Pseudovibrio sp. WM33]KZL19435.1 Mrr restriction system protein [Pseudovibrio sp. WM33]
MADVINCRTFIIEEEGFPDLSQLMLATVEALRKLGGSASIHEMDETVIEREGVSEEEQAILMPNGRYQRLNYYLAWARTYLKRGGALENSSRGVWALTERGETISSRDETFAIWELVNQEEKERARQKRRAAKKTGKPAPARSELPSNVIEETDDYSDWKSELLEKLKSIDPSAFERLSQRLLREAGFVKVEVRGKTGDGGIDGVGVLRVNLVSFQVYFQCKRYKGSVGAKEIRDFRGALQGRADKGLFITTGTFTSQASDEATRDGAIAIDLIDGDRLCELLKQFDLGVKTEMIEKVTVTGEWFGAI